MILSDETLSVLKNFNYINENILFKPGSVIQTISQSQTVMAQATVKENFPVEFGIYELGKFLSALSLFAEKEVTFNKEGYLTLGKGRGKMKYGLAAPNVLVVAPYKDVQFPKDFIETSIPNAQWNTLIKAAQVLELPEIMFNCDGFNLTVSAINSKDPSSNDYELDLGPISGPVFKSVLQIANLKLLELDYTIKISKSQIVHFHNPLVEYWVAASTIE